MTNPARASTQYGDCAGTICVDGFNGLTIFDLIESSAAPKGYWPVGLRIYGWGTEGRDRDGQPPKLSAKVLCVDTDQVGTGPDKILNYCRNNPELHTFEFDAEIDILKLLSQLKRLDIVLLSRVVEDAEVRIQPVQD
ncbi:hypothetical protein FF011L_06200 [Roseimaritima multifibrata]|uniref:Uncharacterized protein n=1 Tax=Roseimaritima multifibrata TaxID=1930274 RepID=A0A517MAI5_9BACT|nr:hypothetical protein [Roseimaritima multifibrata]QDS91884.1 hypothetical protein FF011L_06200 [Roseimaritima multifibrata]